MVQKIEELYQMYFKDVYLYVKAISGNEHIAEEITQETFFKALKGIGKFKGQCDVRVWLCQIAKNTYFTYLRKEGHIVSVESEPADETVSLEDRVIDREVAERIRQTMADMEEPYGGVFRLRVYSELSFREIAKVYGKTESWARVTYYRAKNKIVGKVEEKR